MSHCLANLSISRPISSRYSHPRCRTTSGGITVKATAANGRENLDNLQSQNKQLQQQQPKKRTSPASPIGLWDRFPTARTVQQMMETMESLIDDPFAYSAGWPAPPPPADTPSYVRGRTPWEIKEAETEYKLRFDMPGMTKEDVKVWVEEKMLVVKAEKLPKKTDESNTDEWPAKSYGRYNSRIALPENVDFEKIKAEVKDGVLYITIPKASSRAKVFDISAQ